MDGNIVTAARWLGGSLVLSSAILAMNRKTERPTVAIAPLKSADSPVPRPVTSIVAPPRSIVAMSTTSVVDQESQTTGRVPILDPIDTTNPPTEDEVWEELRSKSPDYASSAKSNFKNRRMLVEKIGDKTDPVKNYPLAGLCRLVHHHYKCTLTFDEPIPTNHSTQRVEVVYLNKDHLIRVASGLEKPTRTR